MSRLAADCEVCRAFQFLEEQGELCACAPIEAPTVSRDTPTTAGICNPLAGDPVPLHLPRPNVVRVARVSVSGYVARDEREGRTYNVVRSPQGRWTCDCPAGASGACDHTSAVAVRRARQAVRINH